MFENRVLEEIIWT